MAIYNNVGFYQSDQEEAFRKIKELQEQMADEKEEAIKNGTEVDKKKMFKLLYAQFVQGLKLNTGQKLFF